VDEALKKAKNAEWDLYVACCLFYIINEALLRESKLKNKPQLIIRLDKRT